jgi:hypothetical protein
LRDWIKNLIRIRQARVSLRRGKIHFIEELADEGLLAFTRKADHEGVMVIANTGLKPVTAELDLGQLNVKMNATLRNLISREIISIIGSKTRLHCPARSSFILFPEDTYG